MIAMRTLILLISAAVLLFAADGPYVGTWTSTQNGNGGSIRVQIKPEARVVFSYESREITTKVVSVEETNTGFRIDYDFEIDGFPMRSSVTATLKGESYEGKYRTKSLADSSEVDQGTLSLKKAQ